MRLVVATNFDDKLPEKIHQYPVKYMYGSQTETLLDMEERLSFFRKWTMKD